MWACNQNWQLQRLTVKRVYYDAAGLLMAECRPPQGMEFEVPRSGGTGSPVVRAILSNAEA